MKNLKQVHEKCTVILEMIESAQRMTQHHSDQVQRLKNRGLDYAYNYQIDRLYINATIVERLKTYYLNQILKLIK